MKLPGFSARKGERTARSRVVRPRLEGLEDRLLLYSYTGDHFTYGSRITWSIVPDGTNLGGVNSNFVSTMNAKFGSGNWIQAINDAFAQWEKNSNVNLVQVSDNGAPTGSGNLQQGSSQFGDIRIGGYFQSSNILAYTLLPPPANGGSDAADIFVNTGQNWNIGSDYDLETTMIHEIGHAVPGLAESTDPSTVMYAYYNGIKDVLQPDDIAGAQNTWGPRALDGLSIGYSNYTPYRSAPINPYMNQSNNQIVLPNMDVANTGQYYWFKVTTPANASNHLTVQIQSQFLSELSPWVQIYNAWGQGLVQTAASPSTYGTTIDAGISNATPNATYFIRVSGSSILASGTGAYSMTVNMGNSPIALTSPPNTTVLAQPDQGGGSSNQFAGNGMTLPTLSQLQAMGDFFNFQPNVHTASASSNSYANSILALLFPWWGESGSSGSSSSTSSSSSSSSSAAVTLSNFSGSFQNLPTVLIGWNTPNYTNGWFGSGSDFGSDS